jgi:hypothetical protein
MRIKIRYNQTIIAVGFLSLLIACTSSAIKSTLVPTTTPPAWIVRWLDNPACLPPCWETIQPGITSIESAAGIKLQYPDMSLETKRGTSTIRRIGLDLSMNDRLPLQMLLSKFGQPDYVRLYKCDPNNRCETHMIFQGIGMVLNAYPDDIAKGQEQTVEISATTPIFTIFFIQVGLNSYYDNFGDGVGKLTPWKNYGLYYAH